MLRMCPPILYSKIYHTFFKFANRICADFMTGKVFFESFYFFDKEMNLCYLKAMKKYFVLIILSAFLISGCAAFNQKTQTLSHGLTPKEVIALWGEPQDKTGLGLTKDNYPVEIWVYSQKASLFHAAHECVLIFVDSELYRWITDDPKAVFEELAVLGVIKKDDSYFGLEQYKKSLQDSANQAIETNKLLEVIRSYKMHETTMRDIQTMQQIRTIQQQNIKPVLPPPPPPPPQKPAEPIRK